MTIDERVEAFAEFKDSAAWDVYLRTLLLDVARDQRHACAKAVLAIRDPNLQWKDIAHQAVMNAEVKQ